MKAARSCSGYLNLMFAGFLCVPSFSILLWSWRTPHVLASGECPDIFVSLDSTQVFPLNHTGVGDQEMKGNYPVISIDAKARLQGDTVLVNGSVQMVEGKADWTTFHRDFVQSTYVADLSDPLCQAYSINPSSGSLRAQTGESTHQWMQYAGRAGTLIQSADCIADTPGSENGKIGCRDILFNSVRIRRRAVQGASSGSGNRGSRNCPIWKEVLGLC